MEEKREEGRRTCRNCGEGFAGRSDKLFCCDLCRTCYNNRIRREELRPTRAVTAALLHNRRLLGRHFRRGELCVPRVVMERESFDFSLFTATVRPFFRRRRYTCFEYTYYISRQGYVHLSLAVPPGMPKGGSPAVTPF